MSTKLSILIATLGRRHLRFSNLVNELYRQSYRYRDKIEILAYYNNGELPIGSIRQKLLWAARGEYICFIDDDDFIPDYYIKEIMGALGKDYIGFRMKVFKDGVELKPSINNLEYPNWHETDEAFCRDITHLNPIKRYLALTGQFSLRGMGEDADWSRMVRPHVKTQNFIDKDMYFYMHSSTDTHFGGWDRAQEERPKRTVIKYNNFRYIS